MAVVSGAGANRPAESLAGRLAQFFTGVTPVRLPVQVSSASGLRENTLLEYASANEVFFATTLALEFGEILEVQNADGSLRAEVVVVAVRYEAGETAVAARFAHDVPNWIVKA